MNKPANTYHQLIDSIGQLLHQGRQQAAIAVNYHIVHTYWEIGRYIVEYEQKGELKQEYGTKLIDILSTDLSNKFGKGFSRSNLFNFRKFYLLFEKVQTPSGQLIISKPFEKIQTVSGQFQKSGTLSHQLKQISETPSHQLSWSHYCELLKIDDNLERSFYEKQCGNEKWSVRELKRQINSALFQRLALSKDNEEDKYLAGIILPTYKCDSLVENVLGIISSQKLNINHANFFIWICFFLSNHRIVPLGTEYL